MTKISKQLCGVAGEYYVAAEFSKRGYLAAITLRNSDGIDILVSDTNGEKSLSIQVKTTQNKRKWILTKKVETGYSKNKYFVFVNIKSDLNCLPEYYIVNSEILANNIYHGHRRWLEEPGKNGRKRNDSSVRQFEPKYFDPSEILNWDQLIEILN
ncbi:MULTISPECIES: hypothetical protein [unclassified Leeuwenhoekiella]|uniref:hypothetical protein n=1 Tax=unclassified Leeuwenhoekiella TaxID=2615029 RepID=UPI0025C21E2F|nr:MULTISPECIES: hypothetical protein [unclassified Leeuwenhoekiella]|tara:strand:- start:3586 stop:4050 length:465 start_codon:yes stop_codon:yes gene_type:complete